MAEPTKRTEPVNSSETTELDEKFAVAGVRGKLRKKTVAKMSDLVEENPEEAVGALRRWLHQED